VPFSIALVASPAGLAESLLLAPPHRATLSRLSNHRVISTEVAAVLFRVPFLGTRRHAAEKSLSRFSSGRCGLTSLLGDPGGVVTYGMRSTSVPC